MTQWWNKWKDDIEDDWDAYEGDMLFDEFCAYLYGYYCESHEP